MHALVSVVLWRSKVQHLLLKMSVVKKPVATIEINILHNSRKKEKKDDIFEGKKSMNPRMKKKKTLFGKITLIIADERKSKAKCNEKKKTVDSATQEKTKEGERRSVLTIFDDDGETSMNTSPQKRKEFTFQSISGKN